MSTYQRHGQTPSAVHRRRADDVAYVRDYQRAGAAQRGATMLEMRSNARPTVRGGRLRAVMAGERNDEDEETDLRHVLAGCAGGRSRG